MKRVLALLHPEAPLLAAAALLLTIPGLRATATSIAAVYPAAVLVVAVLLGTRFNRSRLVFSVAVLSVAYAVAGGGVQSPGERLTFHATSLLLPVNLALIALLPERGTVTPAGLGRWALLGAQAFLVAFLAQSFPTELTPVLKTRFVPGAALEWTPLAQPALLLFVAAAALLTLAWLREPQSPARGYVFALIAVVLGLGSSIRGPGPAVWFATAGLILVVAMVETSYMMAYRDGLTELPGRRALNEALQRLGGQYTIAMVDVDHFKRFNDRHGHDAGDHVLRLVAARLARAAGGGTAYRYGGEEFALLFPGKSADACLPHLEALRAAIEHARFTMRRRFRPRLKPGAPKRRSTHEPVVVTVSIGVAERTPRHDDPEGVIHAADSALYRAKEGGRNRVST